MKKKNIFFFKFQAKTNLPMQMVCSNNFIKCTVPLKKWENGLWHVFYLDISCYIFDSKIVTHVSLFFAHQTDILSNDIIICKTRTNFKKITSIYGHFSYDNQTVESFHWKRELSNVLTISMSTMTYYIWYNTHKLVSKIEFGITGLNRLGFSVCSAILILWQIKIDV